MHSNPTTPRLFTFGSGSDKTITTNNKVNNMDSTRGKSAIPKASKNTSSSLSSHHNHVPTPTANDKFVYHEKDATSDTENALMKSFSSLQNEFVSQLELEIATQSQLESFDGQLVAMRNAFAMLSDVVMHELETTRSETRRRIEQSEVRMMNQNQSHGADIHALTLQFSTLQSRVDEVNDKQDRILEELATLKTEGKESNLWLTSVAEQVALMKDEFAESNSVNLLSRTAISTEVTELRRHFDSSHQSTITRLNEYSAAVSKQQKSVTAMQRIDDLELLEQALSTLQAQQIRLRATVDEAIIPLQTESRNLRSKFDHMGSVLNTVKIDSTKYKDDVENIDRAVQLRFENVSRVFKVFARALHTTVPMSSLEKIL